MVVNFIALLGCSCCPVMVNLVYVVLYIADPEGIANAQKSLGIGQEDKVRRVR